MVRRTNSVVQSALELRRVQHSVAVLIIHTHEHLRLRPSLLANEVGEGVNEVRFVDAIATRSIECVEPAAAIPLVSLPQELAKCLLGEGSTASSPSKDFVELLQLIPRNCQASE